GRAARGPAQEESARAAVGRGPGEIADPLEAEHRVEDVERQHLDAVVAVRGRRGDPRREGPGLVDALLEDLALLVLLVEHELLAVLGLVQLPELAEDPELAEHPLHAERARLVGHDRDDVAADLLVADERVEDPDERHRRRDLAVAGALELGVEGLERWDLERLGGAAALRQVAPERLAALLQVL